jgi:APA family basic amino acid/polyamine antiporter
MGGSRVFFTMACDGLLPRLFSQIHPKFRTPYKSNIIVFCFVAMLSSFVPGDLLGDLTAIGTLFAFVLVCIGIWILRVKNPGQPRPFKTPLVPLVPILGVLFCITMIVSLDRYTQLVAFIWMLIGLVVYFLYGKSHSHLNELEPVSVAPRA